MKGVVFMKKVSIILALIIVFLLTSCGGAPALPNDDADIPHDETSADTFTAAPSEADDLPELTDAPAPESEEPPEIVFLDRQKKLDIVNAYGGVYDPIYRKYVDEAYDIYPIHQIVGDEKCEEWVQNVYLAQTAEETESPPALYQAVKYFGIEKEALYAYNSAIDDEYSSMRIPEFVIEALYYDEPDMLRQTAGVTALFYDGKVYSFAEIADGIGDIPDDIIRDYAAEIEPILRDYFTENEYKKEYSKTIEALKSKGV